MRENTYDDTILLYMRFFSEKHFKLYRRWERGTEEISCKISSPLKTNKMFAKIIKCEFGVKIL